jgi:hypothetical protein
MSVKKMVPIANLVDINEMSTRVREKPNTVRKHILRYPDFPKPIRRFSIGDVWDIAEVKRFYAKRREAKRKKVA